MSYENLLYSVEDRVATITLNRPERMNALSQKLVDEIIAAVAEADLDPEVRVLLVDSAGGKSFSSGYDIKESAEKPKRTLAEWRRQFLAATDQVGQLGFGPTFQRMWNLYLAYSEGGFRSGYLDVHQLVLERSW